MTAGKCRELLVDLGVTALGAGQTVGAFAYALQHLELLATGAAPILVNRHTADSNSFWRAVIPASARLC